ncbi:MAG: response regulator transcription factor [Thermoleophilaceae bacterium]|nr:response regulator transcription factor [Thermoleophilaceae bacterium]
MTESAARVLLVDDDPLVRSGLQLMLGGNSAIEVVAEVDDGDAVLAAVDLHHPDVVLMDIRMNNVDGIAATRLLRGQPSPPAVLILTTFDADDLVLSALRAGASGFLLKSSPPEDIVRAITTVASGESWLSPTIARQLIGLVAAGPQVDDAASARLASLSPREREVADAVGQGISNQEIAQQLHMSVATVKAHVSRLLEKLEVDNRVQIALLIQGSADGS